jgi:triacylglycerol esterase/lipase EstA (alpha/beta hydrolase family)
VHLTFDWLGVIADLSTTLKQLRRLGAIAATFALLAACATTPQRKATQYGPAADSLREARSPQVPVEKRAADYLHAAAITAPLLGPGTQETPALNTYNTAAAELTILLRSNEGGRLWNQPLTVTSNNETYHLHLQPAGSAIWPPDYFNLFLLPSSIKHALVKKETVQEGVGGALVGVRTTTPRENFAPLKGISAPVTATLEFRRKDVTLALRRPAKQPTALVEGKVRPLAADFSAPISYYSPPSNLTLVELMAALRSSRYIDKTGLYFLQPYDPDRIPLVFVHGLVSSPFTWVETINGLQADPEIRKRYQFWVFAYPTGTPILYSALRLREELAKVDRLYPNHHPYVVVGHSMGGILTHAQVVTVTPAMWEKALGTVARDVLARNSSNSLIVRGLVFKANPRIKRVVFICTPHHGSEMASGGIGRLAISLISLPVNVATVLQNSVTQAELTQITGSKRLPNSVYGLQPNNPTFKVVNSAPITAPYHSIIGDRGKGDSPNSTDGVVPYWSSHLDKAQSELVVPGPHGATELPQTIAELDRILRLHVGEKSSSRAAVARVNH